MRVGLGTSNLRSLGRRSSLADVVRLIEAGLTAGPLLVDTADVYGAGSAERALGSAARRSSIVRDRAREGALRIVTKGGNTFSDLPPALRALNQPLKRARRMLDPRQRFDDAWIRRACAASAARLGDLEIDAYCLHNPPKAILQEGSALNTLVEIRDAGLIRRVGVSVDDDEGAVLLVGLDHLELAELPARLWLALPEHDRRAVVERGVEVVVNRVTQIASSPTQALRVLAAMPSPPDVAVVGTRDPDHLRADVEAVRP